MLAPEQLPARLNLAHSLSAAREPCEALAALGSPPDAEHPLRQSFADLQVRLRRDCASAGDR